LEGSTLVNATSLEPNLSIASTLKDLPAGQQLLITLSGSPSDVPLQAQIIQPNGTALAVFEIKDTPFTSSATTAVAGDHTLEVKNVGSKPVTVQGAILNSPVAQQGGGVGVQNNPALKNFVVYGIGILVGILLIIAGIVILIIGAIKYVKGKKTTPKPTS